MVVTIFAMINSDIKTRKAVIIGAGPAGVAAGYRLSLNGVNTVVLEQDAQVGGISRTINYKGNYLDLGGHRFFSKRPEVLAWWKDILKEDFLTVARSSKIFYKGRYFHYPISINGVLSGLGLMDSVLILFSYLKSRVYFGQKEMNLEQWLIRRFGKRLYKTFFKNYSEKVWGLDCARISPDWAAERIRGVSLSAAIRNALSGGRNNAVKSMIKKFYFPRLGAGMMYEAAARIITEQGGQILLNRQVVEIRHDYNNIVCLVCKDMQNGDFLEVKGSDFCSSMPITSLVSRMRPSPPDQVLQSCANLRYRSMILVYLIVKRDDLFKDNWIYIHSPKVKVARIQNFRNWSRDMLAVKDTSSLCLEYFCDELDGFWSQSDEALIDLAVKDIEELNLVSKSDIQDVLVFRVAKAYPVYEKNYLSSLEQIKSFLKGFSNLQCIGRYGMFHYNGMDHSVLTGFLAADNILGAQEDIWNLDMEEAGND